MDWIKWIFNFMHWRYWLVIAIALTAAPLVWWMPFAASTTTSGILIGLFWLAFGVASFVFCMILLTMPRYELDSSRKEMVKWVRKVKFTFTAWWNGRPGNR